MSLQFFRVTPAPEQLQDFQMISNRHQQVSNGENLKGNTGTFLHFSIATSNTMLSYAHSQGFMRRERSARTVFLHSACLEEYALGLGFGPTSITWV